MEEPWTILELAELAAETLAAAPSARPPADGGAEDGAAASGAAASGAAASGAAASGAAASGAARWGPARANGRVRDVPNERLVRWYVTVGLVDPPLSRRGRVAQYGRRHLLQLVAVKRRQAEGRSLAEIQAELAGATDEKLAAVARVPDTLPAPEAPAAAPGRFWARRPGPSELTAAEGPGPAVAQRAGRLLTGTGRGDPADRGRGGLVHGVRLAPGVTLLLEDADREPGPDDVTEILNTARPLLEELARRRLRADHWNRTEESRT